jgi:hypothetical protein
MEVGEERHGEVGGIEDMVDMIVLVGRFVNCGLDGLY